MPNLVKRPVDGKVILWYPCLGRIFVVPEHNGAKRIDKTPIIKVFKDYFPHVQFPQNSTLNGYFKDDAGQYLDIPKMMGSERFKSLFSSIELDKSDAEELKNELIKNEKEDKRLNVLLFSIRKKGFAEKYAEGFAKTLEKKIKQNIEPKNLEQALIEVFFEPSQDISCIFDEKKCNWYSSYHNPRLFKTSFLYNVRKNCNLHLYGAEFNQFKEKTQNWPDISGKNESKLPLYLANYEKNSAGEIIFKGLKKEFDDINADDFLWKQHGKAWAEKESIRHLLTECFKLDDFNVSLKDVWYSFCITVLKKEDYQETPDEKRYIKFGDAILENTLKKNIHQAIKNRARDYYESWFRKFAEKLYPKRANHKIFFLDSDEKEKVVSYIYDAWRKRISEILESKLSDTEGTYYLRDLIEFIEQAVSGIIRLHYESKTDTDFFTKTDRINIKKYIRKISGWDKRLLDGINKFSSYNEKITKIYQLYHNNNDIEEILKGSYKTIRVLYKKTLPPDPPPAPKTPEDQLLEKLEKEEQLKRKRKLFSEEKRQVVITYIMEEFNGNDETMNENIGCWLKNLKEMPLNEFWRKLDDYPPHSEARKIKPNTFLFIGYCEAMHINKEINQSQYYKKHDDFKEKMRTIADKLKKEGYWDKELLCV